MNDCLFCKIIAKQIPTNAVYETEDVFAFLDIHPVNKGHILVVPKKHSQGSHDAEPETLQKLIVEIQKVAQAMIVATQAPAYNIIQNNGAEAGQAISHLHFHLIPRFDHDGHHMWHGKENYGDGEAALLAQRIKQAL